MARIPVGVLGATGMVGQHYLSLLKDHPWFEARYAAASPKSAGKEYRDAVAGRWHLSGGAEPSVWSLKVEDANDVSRAVLAFKKGECSFVFSALEMGKGETGALEEAYAAAG
ncbi:MAG: aspartate-semialdehyde dehydrogenase, partial [Treponema sp.]|nr:aspartate-semialdehyde dehydrogenase [Treponema sp.]